MVGVRHGDHQGGRRGDDRPVYTAYQWQTRSRVVDYGLRDG